MYIGGVCDWGAVCGGDGVAGGVQFVAGRVCESVCRGV